MANRRTAGTDPTRARAVLGLGAPALLGASLLLAFLAVGGAGCFGCQPYRPGFDGGGSGDPVAGAEGGPAERAIDGAWADRLDGGATDGAGADGVSGGDAAPDHVFDADATVPCTLASIGDAGAPPADGGTFAPPADAAGSRADGASAADGGDAWPVPCDPPCAPGEVCTVAGQCAFGLFLTADPDENYRRLARAVVECFRYAAYARDASRWLCFGVDARALAVPIADADYDDWVCSQAMAGDFARGQVDLAEARDDSGCGGFFDADNSVIDLGNDALGGYGRHCLIFSDLNVDHVAVVPCRDAAGFPNGCL